MSNVINIKFPRRIDHLDEWQQRADVLLDEVKRDKPCFVMIGYFDENEDFCVKVSDIDPPAKLWLWEKMKAALVQEE